MKLRSIFLSLATLALLAFSTGCNVNGNGFGPEVREETNRTLEVSAAPTIVVKNTNGAVRVESWDKNQVEIHAVKTAHGRDHLDDVKIDIFATNSRVEINSETKHELHIGVMQSTTVEYVIKAPRNANVRLKTVNGEATTQGIGGDLFAETVNGHVGVKGSRGSVELHTVNGGIDAELEKLGERIKLETVNGGVSLTAPSPLDAQVDVQTVNGGVSEDFDLHVNRPQYGPGANIHEKVGAGRSHLELKTVNGGVELHKL